LYEPTSSGGETALCDFTKVYKGLSSELSQKFLDKTVMYTRIHKKIPTSNSLFNFDVADMKGWPDLFGTDDKQEVERICKEEGVDVQWKGDTFATVIKSEAFQLHPITQEPVWFNHSGIPLDNISGRNVSHLSSNIRLEAIDPLHLRIRCCNRNVWPSRIQDGSERNLWRWYSH
jgi:hypothetical protein